MKVLILASLITAMIGCATLTNHSSIIDKIVLSTDSVAVNGYLDSGYVIRKTVLNTDIVDILNQSYRGSYSISKVLRIKYSFEEEGVKRVVDAELIRIQPKDNDNTERPYIVIFLYLSGSDNKWHVKNVNRRNSMFPTID